MLKLDPLSLDWALSHVESFGDTDIFPIPFEFNAIRYAWSRRLRPWLADQDILNWKTRPYRRCLSPKHRFGFRISTQLDPLDTLVLSALVYEIGADLEMVRVGSDHEVVHSYRFNPKSTGEMYDASFTFESFQRRSRDLSRSRDFAYVVTADIADFFPRLYFHPLENALSAATNRKLHVNAICQMIKRWNFSVSYGIPVGPSAPRLLAEIAIDDVDRSLLGEAVTYCRFSDDFRIFCKTQRQAHENLALLANILFENHGLTLQQHKTEVMTVEEFQKRYLRPERSHEALSLTEKFEQILKELGIHNPYEEIEYDDLSTEIQERIDSLNLEGILKEQIAGDGEIDLLITRFVLRRLNQLDNANAVDVVLNGIERLYPVFKDALGYIQGLRSLSRWRRFEIGKQMIEMLETSIVGHLEYHRALALDVFAKGSDWNNASEFIRLYHEYPDEFTRRKLILALGRAGKSSWFKTQKRNLDVFRPWERRALLAAATCLPGDESRHWHRSIARNLDELEKAIVLWAEANPFGAQTDAKK